jgi:DNA-binding LytR/AlgR family response regulator
MDSGDPRTQEVAQAACEEIALLKQPVISASAKREHATAVFGKKEVEPSNERIDAPLTAGFQKSSRGRARSLIKILPRTRMLATEKFARIAIKSKGRILFIDAADVIAVEAKGNYVLLLRTSDSHMLRESISTMEEKLHQHGFVRIHRSVLVNAASVEEIHPRSTGEYVLRLRGGREFIVTRTYRSNLQLLAQLWIGMNGFAAE